MYVPDYATLDDDAARTLVAEVGSGWLVTNGHDGPPETTLLPILWRDDTVTAHLPKANPHWRSVADGAQGLIVVSGPEAYVSPSWYPSKLEHGRAVPTWNYLAVHIAGSLRIHHDPDWLRTAVTDLTDTHEDGRPARWHVTDAPETFVTSQLKGIVGVEMQVERVEGKAKLSQNRSGEDRAGVVQGLHSEAAGEADRRIAKEMAARDPAT